MKYNIIKFKITNWPMLHALPYTSLYGFYHTQETENIIHLIKLHYFYKFLCYY
jgi:hypothetical protein